MGVVGAGQAPGPLTRQARGVSVRQAQEASHGGQGGQMLACGIILPMKKQTQVCGVIEILAFPLAFTVNSPII